MATKKDLLVLLLDVGEHMQPYLPLLHRLVFSVLNGKLISKPSHEVAVVLYGTKETRHELYDPDDPSYTHVTVLRPLQNIASYLELRRFAFASDPPQLPDGDDAAAAATVPAPTAPDAAAEAALLTHVEAAGLGGGGDTAAAVSRAARLFGPPGPKADWADGLVVALDLLARAMGERFEKGRAEANKLGAVRVHLLSNLLAESMPFDDDFRASLVENCINRNIQLDVACLDHYVPPQQPPSGAATGEDPDHGAATGEDPDDGGAAPGASQPAKALAGGEGSYGLALLPAALAESRRRNLGQLHLLKAELAPGMFRHLRQPAEVICLFRSKEVSLQASNMVFKLTPGSTVEEDAAGAAGSVAINVKLYKKIRRTIVDEWRSVLDAPPAPAQGADDADGADGAGGARGGDFDRGFVREVEYEDPVSGEKFCRDDFIAKGYSYGKQAVPVAMYHDRYTGLEDEQARKLREKDLSLLGFVGADSVPRHQLIDEPYVVLGDSPASAVAVAALALVLKERQQAGVVRFLIRKEAPQLGLLTPHLSTSTDVPHALLLSPLPFAEDLRTHAFSTFRNELEARDLPRLLAEARGEAPPPSPPAAAAAAEPLGGGSGSETSQLSGLGASLVRASGVPQLRHEKLQPDAEQQDAALALVRALDLGPSPLPGAAGGGVSEPRPEALAPEVAANPVLQRVYTLVGSRALDPAAQLPDPEDDPLVQLVLQPTGCYWPAGARQALRRAEEKLQTRAKRPRLEPGAAAGEPAAAAAAEAAAGDGGSAAGGPATAPGADAVGELVFDPTAAAGTAAPRVTRVRELSAVEDFKAMMAQGRESGSEAVQQMQELVRVLVGRSIGDQLYDKALQCVQALRAGCAASGRVGRFNCFLQELADWSSCSVAAVAVTETLRTTVEQWSRKPRARSWSSTLEPRRRWTRLHCRRSHWMMSLRTWTDLRFWGPKEGTTPAGARGRIGLKSASIKCVGRW